MTRVSHGGADPGAVGYVVEKDVVLDICDHIAPRLKDDYRVSVTWTRADDYHVSLDERIKIANGCGADVFVSIHANASGGTGFESFRWPGSAEGQRLQGCIHAEVAPLLMRYGLPDRGLKEARFRVLGETRMPAVLVECLFVDHPKDAALLADHAFRRELGVRIADGIASYLGVELVRENDYKVSPQFAEAVKMAREKGLSKPGPGHDYTQPLTEERFWTLVARIMRW